MEDNHNHSKEIMNDPDNFIENNLNSEEKDSSNLQETYDIDEESFYSGSQMSKSEDSIKNQENYLYFLQSVKDGNIDFLCELIIKNDISLCNSLILI